MNYGITSDNSTRKIVNMIPHTSVHRSGTPAQYGGEETCIQLGKSG